MRVTPRRYIVKRGNKLLYGLIAYHVTALAVILWVVYNFFRGVK